MLEVRDAYAQEAFEWDQLQRLALKDTKTANLVRQGPCFCAAALCHAAPQHAANVYSSQSDGSVVPRRANYSCQSDSSVVPRRANVQHTHRATYTSFQSAEADAQGGGRELESGRRAAAGGARGRRGGRPVTPALFRHRVHLFDA